MRRRVFLALAGSAIALPSAVRSQQEHVRLIGVVTNFVGDDPDIQQWLKVLHARLQALGWEIGRNLRIESRFSGGDSNRRQAYVREIVGLRPDVIVAVSTPTVAALQEATRTIPIVFVNANNPVGMGFVQSMARPGGNITGFLTFEPTIAGKWLELLKQIAPAVSRVALVHNPQTHTGQYFESAETAAQSLQIKVLRLAYRDAAELARALVDFAREPNGGLVSLPDSSNIVNRELIIQTAAKFRLPAIYSYRPFVTDGGLAYYGSDPSHLYVQAAQYVDRILRGAKPAELPVQAPTNFEMVLNLKTAGTLGLDVPMQIQQLADEVIK
jgi:putative tryptophan/tyrosine transport system substrate-binding protein